MSTRSKISSIRGLMGIALLICATPAGAQPDGWYLGIGAGWSTLDPVKAKLDPPFGPASGNLTLNDTAAVHLDVGYKFKVPIRVEAEIQYADFDADHLKVAGLPTTNLTGDAAVTSFFANAIYDIPLSRHFTFNIGAGIGVAQLDPSISGAAANGLHDSDTAFTWQAIAGFTVPLGKRFEVEADYRYQGLGNTNHTFFNGFNSPISLKNKTIQSVMLNLRWYMEAPPSSPPVEAPPPPPPPASPSPVKTFIVFFDFDKADLSDEAVEVVAQATQAAKSTGTVRVLVTGHTDTVGSAAYNQALSERRASAVKAQMVSDGLAEGAISTIGKGFDDPLVQTGPNVREPQNRRAVIDLGG
jgi:outer membrane protein OmpA-like peptidoglycan-associated protein